MIKDDIFLTCIHDRRTDDKYRAFTALDEFVIAVAEWRSS